MAGRVKRNRSYDSPLRREQAARTREQILDSAKELFERDGYAATTMAAIASAAGVSLKTVYLAFETKSGLYALSGTSSSEASRTRFPSASSPGTARSSMSPTPSANYGSMLATP